MRVVLLGDSVTAGFGLRDQHPEQCYPRLLSAEFAHRQLPLEILPSALDGIDTRYALRRFARMVTAFEPDVVVVLLGLNDARPAGARPPVSPPAYQQNLLAIVDRIRAIAARAIIATPNPRFDLNSSVAYSVAEQGKLLRHIAPGQGSEWMCPYAEAARSVARRQRLPLVDLYRAFAASHALADLIPDGIHPGLAGHRLIAATFGEALLPWLSDWYETSRARGGTQHGTAARALKWA